MQIKTKSFLPSILLLALPEVVFAAPEDAVPVRYLQASALGVSKRNTFMLGIQPQYMAMPLDANPLVKRQSCPTGSSTCYDGCCKTSTVCGIYGGEKGCCPIGKNCNSVSGCQNSDDVYCTTYCCPAGTTCDLASKGCNKQTDNTGGSQCDTGYSPCTQFNGCCPNGTQCILPKNCNVPCASDDPVCGTGCCQKGYVCTSSNTCAKDNSSSFTTLVQPTAGTTKAPIGTPKPTTDLLETPTDSPSTGETDSPSSTTDNFLNGFDTSTTSTTSTTTTAILTSTRRTIVTTTTAPVPGANSAPTMGAMLGGSLGMAAGIFGALAL